MRGGGFNQNYGNSNMNAFSNNMGGFNNGMGGGGFNRGGMGGGFNNRGGGPNMRGRGGGMNGMMGGGPAGMMGGPMGMGGMGMPGMGMMGGMGAMGGEPAYSFFLRHCLFYFDCLENSSHEGNHSLLTNTGRIQASTACRANLTQASLAATKAAAVLVVAMAATTKVAIGAILMEPRDLEASETHSSTHSQYTANASPSPPELGLVRRSVHFSSIECSNL